GKAMLDHLENVARELAIEEVVLDATLNAASFYRRHGYTGDEQAVYHSPSGLQLACIPMTKRIS
ncbi:GNAT family N-acetyltransferase, partial [Klebsiella pneumoniae]